MENFVSNSVKRCTKVVVVVLVVIKMAPWTINVDDAVDHFCCSLRVSSGLC